MRGIALRSAHQQATAIRTGEISATELLELTLERYERLNPAMVDALGELGVQLDWTARPDIEIARLHDVYITLLRAATGTEHSDEQYAALAGDADRFDAGDRDYRARAARSVRMSRREWAAFHSEREYARLAWDAFFDEFDALLCPTASTVAYPHDQVGERADRTVTVNGREQGTTDQLFWAGLSCGGVPPRHGRARRPHRLGSAVRSPDRDRSPPRPGRHRIRRTDGTRARRLPGPARLRVSGAVLYDLEQFEHESAVAKVADSDRHGTVQPTQSLGRGLEDDAFDDALRSGTAATTVREHIGARPDDRVDIEVSDAVAADDEVVDAHDGPLAGPVG